MMKKLFCVLLTAVLLLCCASALAEQCKYGSADSPCEPNWWVDTVEREHARACFYHVEDKEDMNSHVLITPWEKCTLDGGGECTVCGWDYVREPEPDDYDMYWLEMYYFYTEMYGEPPVKVSESNGKLTITFNSDWFTFLDEMGVPYTESAMVATEITLTEVGGVLDVEVSEYGPGRWLMRAGMMSVGGPNGGVVEVKVEGKTYTLGSAGGVDLDHCKYYKEDSPCRPKWWVDKKNQQHARACFYHVEDKEDMSSHVLITPWEACTLDAESVCTVCGHDYDPDLTQEDYDIMMLESFYASSGGGADWQVTVEADGNRLIVAFTDEVFALMDQFERPYTESSTKPSEITLERIGGAWQVTVSEDGPAPWFQRMGMGWLLIDSIAEEGDSASVEITVCGEAYTLTAGGSEPETPALPDDEAYEQALVEAYYTYVDRMSIAPVHGVVSGDTLTITLTQEFFVLLDELGIVHTEHLEAETLYTLRETAEGWQVVSSGYGPGLWLEKYGLLGIEVTPLADGTATAYIAAHLGLGYTLPDKPVLPAEYCKYYSPDSPCDVIWWLDKDNQQHCRACRNHVEDKEDMYSYVPVTEWTPCTPGEDYICTGCGWDYSPTQGPSDDLSQEDCDAYMQEIYYRLLEKRGVPPMDVTLDGDTLTLKVNEQFQMYMLERGIPVTETLLAGTTYTLKQVDGTWTVEATEYGPGAWLARTGLIAIGDAVVSGGKAEAEIALDGGEGYVLTAGGSEPETPALPDDEAYEQALVEAYYTYVDRMSIAPVHGVVSGDTLTITLTQEFFVLLDELGIVHTEHLEAETLYTLRETAEGWQVVSSGYGPGLWLEKYGLLGIEVTPLADGTATAYIAAHLGLGYTLPEKPVLPAEYCKYYSPDSPCDVIWWLDKDNQQHCRACRNHVEDKEDMYSYVLVTEWTPCTPGEDYICTGCGWDYSPTQGPSDDLSQEDCDAYMQEIYYRLLEKRGVPPMDVTLDGDTLTLKVNEQFQMYMLERGIPVTETLLAGTTYTLKQVNGAWTVASTEYGPGAWLARTGLIAIGDAVVSGGKAEAEIALDGGEGYVLTAGAASPVILPGDASGDGEVDIFDALAVLQYAVGWGNELDASAGDVNDDGACDIFDALLILQYAVGWDVELK